VDDGQCDMMSHFPPSNISLELLPMTSYFSDIVRDLKDRTEVATNALTESEETAEVSLSFLVAKAIECVLAPIGSISCEGVQLFSESSPFRYGLKYSPYEMLSMILNAERKCQSAISM
jgi:hypothetical protein